MTLAGYGLIGLVVYLLIGKKGIDKSSDLLESWTKEDQLKEN